MTKPGNRMKQLLVCSACALTLGAMSGAASANMCMKKPHGHHAYMKPMPAYGMHRYPGPMQSYGYPAQHHGMHSFTQPSEKKSRKNTRPQQSATAEEPPLPPARGPDIIEIAAAAGEFDTLIKAVVAADLYDTLRGDGPFRVFAPTDAAFARLPAGTLDELLANKDKLGPVNTM